MMTQEAKNERRQCNERRLVKLGVPIDLNERRVNIERRLFNLDTRCFSSWLGGANATSSRAGCPHPEPLGGAQPTSRWISQAEA